MIINKDDNMIVFSDSFFVKSAGTVEYPTGNEFSGYNIKPSDGEAPAMEIWGMLSTVEPQLTKTPLYEKIQNTKRATKKFPSHLTKKYSRYENENQKCRTRKVK